MLSSPKENSIILLTQEFIIIFKSLNNKSFWKFLFSCYIITYVISSVSPLGPQSRKYLHVALHRKSLPTLDLEGTDVSKWESRLRKRNEA